MIPFQSMLMNVPGGKKKATSFTNPAISLMHQSVGFNNQTTAKRVLTTAHGKLRETTKQSLFETS